MVHQFNKLNSIQFKMRSSMSFHFQLIYSAYFLYVDLYYQICQKTVSEPITAHSRFFTE